MSNIQISDDRAPYSNGVSSRTLSRKGVLVANRYELAREIARGGMGVVFEGRNVFTGRTVALKFVPVDSPQAALGRRRLLQEARALGSVRHPNVVEIFDAGECLHEGPYIAMEMLEGRTLDGILAARRTLGLEEVLHVAKRVGRALAFAHQRGVAHRDVKPSNIFVVKSQAAMETVKLIDFGIAGAIGAAAGDDDTRRITKAGDMLGTLDYVSPEQLAHADVVDPRSDQYALAMVIYECLTGSVPPISDRLQGPSHMLDLRKVVPGIQDHVVLAVNRAMMPRAEARFATVEAFMEAVLHDRRSNPIEILSQDNPAKVERAETRRRHRRAPYVTPCRVIREDGSHIDARTEDISEGGVLVVLPQGFSNRAGSTDLSAALAAQGAMESVRIRFALPTTGLIAALSGTVRWIKDGRGRAALGIEFDGLSTEAKLAIATYVRHLGEQ